MATEPPDELELRIQELKTEDLARRVVHIVIFAFALLALAVLAIALIVS